MKLLVIAQEIPFPPIHGGRVDIYNRLISLRETGSEILLLTWKDFQATDSLSNGIQSFETEGIKVIALPFNRGINRLINTVRLPWHVAARVIDDDIYQNTLLSIKEFKPDYLFIDGLYSAHTGMKLASDLKLKVGIRLHNVEADYMKGQFLLSTTIREKISLALSLLHLRKYEQKMIRMSDAFFDISLDDLYHRKRMGLHNGHWLPPVHIKKIYKSFDPSWQNTEASDICFFGNLNAPNNLLGLKWFITMVLPHIEKEIKNASFLIMGSKPSEYVYKLVSNKTNITVLANPEAPDAYLKTSKVLINPVQFGSGVNVKTIDMLFLDNPVVTTSVGVKGLPADFDTVFYIADQPQEFAAHIVSILQRSENSVQRSGRTELRKKFSGEVVGIIDKVLTGN